LPIVREIRPGRPAKGPPLPRRLAAAWRAKYRCEQWDDPKQPSYRLDDSHHLFLLRCQAGAHDYWPVLLTGRRPDGSDARPARFDHDSSYSEQPYDSKAPVNGSWEEDRGRLTSAWNGECGFIEEWAWDGRMFRLVEHIEMVTGAMDRFSVNCTPDPEFWIPTWRARVVR
jgi:hypothetical protein